MLQINSTVEKAQAGTLAVAFDALKSNVKRAEGELPDTVREPLLGGKKLSNALGQVLPSERNAATEEQKTLSFSELIKSVLPESSDSHAKVQGEAVDLQQFAETQIGLGLKGEFSPQMSEQALANDAETKLGVDSELQELRGQAMAFVQASLNKQSESTDKASSAGSQLEMEQIDISEVSDEFKESLKTLLDQYMPQQSQADESASTEKSALVRNAAKLTNEVSSSAMGFIMSAMATHHGKQSQSTLDESESSSLDAQASTLFSSGEVSESAKQQFANEFQQLVESEFGEVPESPREWQKLVDQSLESILADQESIIAQVELEVSTLDASESADSEVIETAAVIVNTSTTEEQAHASEDLLESSEAISSVQFDDTAEMNEDDLKVDLEQSVATLSEQSIESEVIEEDTLASTSSAAQNSFVTGAETTNVNKNDVVEQTLADEQGVPNSLYDQATVTEIDESVEQAELNLAAQAQPSVNASNQPASSNSTASNAVDSGRASVANQVGQSGQQMAGDSRQEGRQDARQEARSDNRQDARQDLPAGELGKSNANSEAAVSKTASNAQQMAQQLSSLMAQGKSSEMQDKVPVSQMMQAQQKGLEQQANLRAVEASLTQTSTLDSDGLPLAESSAGERRSNLPPGLQSIPLPVKHPQWGQALGQRVVYMTNSQLQQAQITLNPEKLGPIQIKLHMDRDQQMQVSLNAQHGTTKEALEAAIPRLREMLEQNGVNLSSVDVGDFSQFAEEQMNEDSSENSNSGVHLASTGEEEPLTTSEQILQTESDQLVDYYA